MGQGESGEHDPGLSEEYAGDAALEAARGRGGAALEAALDCSIISAGHSTFFSCGNSSELDFFVISNSLKAMVQNC